MVDEIEANPTANGDKPIKEVIIKDCGVREVTKPFAVSKEPVNGDIKKDSY